MGTEPLRDVSVFKGHRDRFLDRWGWDIERTRAAFVFVGISLAAITLAAAVGTATYNAFRMWPLQTVAAYLVFVAPVLYGVKRKY
jgi:hypothetical protein